MLNDVSYSYMLELLETDNPYNVSLQGFEGPLELLLHLIRENQIDIYDIPIVKVTQQYLAYLSLMESLDLDIAGEWLVMAATLTEIKSRMLLPKETFQSLEEEQIDPRLELVERLIEYERIKSAAEIFRDKEEQRFRIFARGMEPDFDMRPRVSLDGITADHLLLALQAILSDMGEEEVTTIQRRKVSLRLRIQELWNKINKSGQLMFDSLFDDAQDRVDVVITFLALLELLKMRRIKAKQKTTFAPIEIIALAG